MRSKANTEKLRAWMSVTMLLSIWWLYFIFLVWKLQLVLHIYFMCLHRWVMFMFGLESKSALPMHLRTWHGDFMLVRFFMPIFQFFVHWRGWQGRRKRSPFREGSEERHAKIAQWNQVREHHEETANKVNVDNCNKDSKHMIMNISSRYHCSKENLDTDLPLMSGSFSLCSNHFHIPVAQLGCSFSANIVFLVLHALQLGILTKAHQASATSNFTVLNWVSLLKLVFFLLLLFIEK